MFAFKGLEILVFRKILRTYLMNDLLDNFRAEICSFHRECYQIFRPCASGNVFFQRELSKKNANQTMIM